MSVFAKHTSLPRFFGAVIGTAMLCACSGTSVLNHLNRAEHYKSHSDIAYGPHPRHTMDVYQPRTPSNRDGCLIVFVYGGGWDSGAKEQYGFVGAALAKRGHTVVIPDYRLYPEVIYPGFVEDIAQATASSTVGELQQERPLIMMGHSAGAMIAGLISYNPQYLTAYGAHKSDISAYISLAGPHDYFLPSDKKRWKRIFGDDKKRQQSALTVEHIHPDNPPTLLLHGGADKTVTPKSAASLQRQLQAQGVKARRSVYDGVGHVRLLAAMGWPLQFLAPTLEDISAFTARQCNPATGDIGKVTGKTFPGE